MGRVLFSYGLVPFELSSALLMIAVIGAVAVARGREIQKPGRQPLSAASEGSPMTPAAPHRQPGELQPQGGE
jgi:NADH-quinone oxidoreductase subunit J